MKKKELHEIILFVSFRCWINHFDDPNFKIPKMSFLAKVDKL